MHIRFTDVHGAVHYLPLAVLGLRLSPEGTQGYVHTSQHQIAATVAGQELQRLVQVLDGRCIGLALEKPVEPDFQPKPESSSLPEKVAGRASVSHH